MEEKLDKLISLMETQNKAWEKCLELLFSLAETMTADKKQRQLLLERHPPPRNTPTEVAAAANYATQTGPPSPVAGEASTAPRTGGSGLILPDGRPVEEIGLTGA